MRLRFRRAAGCSDDRVRRSTKRLDRMDEDLGASLKDHLAAVNKDLAIARERLVHYESQ